MVTSACGVDPGGEARGVRFAVGACGPQPSLLVTLHDRKNRVQTRARLLDDVWGIQSDITTRTVDTHVKRLREKLGPAGEYVETVRGVGYRFAEQPGVSTEEA